MERTIKSRKNYFVSRRLSVLCDLLEKEGIKDCLYYYIKYWQLNNKESSYEEIYNTYISFKLDIESPVVLTEKGFIHQNGLSQANKRIEFLLKHSEDEKPIIIRDPFLPEFYLDCLYQSNLLLKKDLSDIEMEKINV